MLLQHPSIRHELLQQGQVLQGLTGDSKGGLFVHDVWCQGQALDGGAAPPRLCCLQEPLQDLGALLVDD